MLIGAMKTEMKKIKNCCKKEGPKAISKLIE
jgi:hypothetical protein